MAIGFPRPLARIAALRRDISVLALACRDPRVPWYAKALVGLVVAYALSPIDLVPDAIPVLGYLDDLLLLPLGIALAVRLIPSDVLAEHRRNVEERAEHTHRRSWLGAAIVVAIWLAIAFWLISLVSPAV